MESEINPSLSEEDVEVGSSGAPWNDKTLAIFIDLMDEEVKKKDRPSATFSKNSWHFIQDRMQELTNYPYTHMQLRNKFNLLRIIYRSFKSLLAQPGVTETPGVWKVYAKEETWNRLYVVNKNAKNFKKKGCPHYDKLCNIYGDTAALDEHARLLTRLSSEIDPNLNEEFVEHAHQTTRLSSEIDSIFNKEVEHARPSKRLPSEIDPSLNEQIVEVGSSSAPWNDRTVAIFIDLMDQEVKKKNMGTTTFSKPSWLFIQARMKELTNYPYTDNQLRNKFNLLRTIYRSFKSLLEQTGVTATPGIWKVHAEEETWYKLYVVNKNAKNFKKKGCPHYDKLCNIYGDITATGELTYPSTRLPSDDENEGSCDFDPTTKNIKEIDDDEETDYLTTHKRKRASSPKRRVRKESIGRALTNIMSAFVESSTKRTELLNRKSLASCEPCGEARTDTTPTDGHALLMESIGALDALEEIDDLQYLKVLKLLREDPVWREIFLKIPLNRRRGVVLNL
ncbi:hypothetical protein LIER_24353 [Lithospermum erythrorhizon]|uniref:Myb/SANT-like domain-containing protein n=1 Tax=Lithospermum erythrorhizon TaxID=34254 RepID=A0AAV3R1X6_LITER